MDKATEMKLVELMSDFKNLQAQSIKNLEKLNDSHLCLNKDMTDLHTAISANQALILKLLTITTVALALLAGAEKILSIL